MNADGDGRITGNDAVNLFSLSDAIIAVDPGSQNLALCDPCRQLFAQSCFTFLLQGYRR